METMMSQHVIKMLVLEEIEKLAGSYQCHCGCCTGRYSRYPQMLPDDADNAYFEFYMPSYNIAYSESCGYAGDTHEHPQIARPPYYWDVDVGKWYPLNPTEHHVYTDSDLVYTHTQNNDLEENSHVVKIRKRTTRSCIPNKEKTKNNK